MKLIEYLEETGVTQYRFAKNIGKFRSNVSSWIKGRSKPSNANQQLIHDATNGKVTFEDW